MKLDLHSKVFNPYIIEYNVTLIHSMLVRSSAWTYHAKELHVLYTPYHSSHKKIILYLISIYSEQIDQCEFHA